MPQNSTVLRFKSEPLVHPVLVHRPRSLRHRLPKTIPRNEPTSTHTRGDSFLPIRFRLDVSFLKKPRNWNSLCDLGRRRNGTHCDHWNPFLWREFSLRKDSGARSCDCRSGSAQGLKHRKLNCPKYSVPGITQPRKNITMSIQFSVNRRGINRNIGVCFPECTNTLGNGN